MSSGRTVDVRSAAGFTLLEVLVAIALLGLLMGLLFGAVRFGNRAWQASDAWADRSDRIGIVENFLRQEISQVQPALVASASGADVLMFDGGPAALVFVAPMPAPLATSGLYRIELRIVRRRLEMMWSGFDAPGTVPSQLPAGSTVLVDGVAGLEFGYFGAAALGQPRKWHGGWSGVDHLPSLIRVRLRAAGDAPQDWPELLVQCRMVPPPERSAVSP